MDENYTPDWLQRQQLMTKVMKLPYDKTTLVLYMTVNMMIGSTIGYGLANTNNLQPTFQALYDWPNDKSAAWNNSAIGASYLLGLSLGAFLGGILVGQGRRKTILIAIGIGFVGCAIQASLKYEIATIIGRIIYGVSSGMLSTAINRLTEEYVPLRVFTQMAPLFHFSINIGILIGTFTGLTLPKEDASKVELVQDQAWRYILGAPVVFYLIILVMLLFFIKNDSPKYYILTGRKDKAIEAIHFIYGIESDMQARTIYDFICKCQNRETIKTTIREAFTFPEYREGSWVNFGCVIFHELLGSNCINLYSYVLFLQILDKGTGILTPRGAVYTMQIFQFLASAVSIYTARSFGRRKLLMIGQFGCGICLFLIGIFIACNVNWGVILSFCIFLTIYQNTTGPVTWIYAQETLTDTALGVCLQALWGTSLLMSVTAEPILDSGLTESGTFFVLSVLAIAGGVFMYYHVRETLGLTEKAKKELYCHQSFEKTEEQLDADSIADSLEERPRQLSITDQLLNLGLN